MRAADHHWTEEQAALLRRLALAGHTMRTAATAIGCSLAAVRSRTKVDDIFWYPKRSAPVLRAWVGDAMKQSAARARNVALTRAKADLAAEIAAAKLEQRTAPLFRCRESDFL